MYMYNVHPMSKLIGHLDADCFYVSCERVRYPHLKGIPVGVLSNQGACVIAQSYELKAKGITIGLPIWEAQPICPEAVFMKRDFEWYELISRSLYEAVKAVGIEAEYYSIDEQFFTADHLEQHYRKPLIDAAYQLQHDIFQSIGVPVSIGISHSKTLAKLASTSVKPYGCCVLREQKMIDHFLSEIPVNKITGVARRSQRKLNDHSVYTCKEFVEADRRLIRKLLTKTGEELWWELRGTIAKPLLTSRPINKVVARGGSVGPATNDLDKMQAWVVRNTERLIEGLDAHELYCDRIAMSLRYKSGFGVSHFFNLPQSTAAFSMLLPTAMRLFKTLYSPGHLLQYMHVIAEKLRYRDVVQQNFFSQQSEKDKRLAHVKRLINQRVSRFALRSGATLPLYRLYQDAASNYDVCDIYGKTCF